MDVFGSSAHVRTLDGHATVDVFGSEFVQACATPTVTVADSPSSTHRASSGMVVLPAAPLRIILGKVEASVAEIADEQARKKLVWLKQQLEDGIASLA